VLYGWVDYHCPGADWSGVQTFPRTVSLDTTATPPVLRSHPIPEIASLYASSAYYPSLHVPTIWSGALTIAHGTLLDVSWTVVVLPSSATRRFAFDVCALAPFAPSGENDEMGRCADARTGDESESGH
jgi:hypothetical protein